MRRSRAYAAISILLVLVASAFWGERGLTLGPAPKTGGEGDEWIARKDAATSTGFSINGVTLDDDESSWIGSAVLTTGGAYGDLRSDNLVSGPVSLVLVRTKDGRIVQISAFNAATVFADGKVLLHHVEEYAQARGILQSFASSHPGSSFGVEPGSPAWAEYLGGRLEVYDLKGRVGLITLRRAEARPSHQ